MSRAGEPSVRVSHGQGPYLIVDLQEGGKSWTFDGQMQWSSASARGFLVVSVTNAPPDRQLDLARLLGELLARQEMEYRIVREVQQVVPEAYRVAALERLRHLRVLKEVRADGTIVTRGRKWRSLDWSEIGKLVAFAQGRWATEELLASSR